MLFPARIPHCDLGHLTGARAPAAPLGGDVGRGVAQRAAHDRFERPGAAAAAGRHELAHASAAPAAPRGAEDGLVGWLQQLLQQLFGAGAGKDDTRAPSGAPASSAACASTPAPASRCVPVNRPTAPLNGGRPDLYAKVPEVDGSAAGWQRAAPIVEGRTVGTQSNREGIHMNGQSPWSNADGKLPERAAVWWALQKNADVKYDADKKEFFTTKAGGQRDQTVATLADVMGAMNAAGGPSPSNGAAYQAVGQTIDDAVRRARGGIDLGGGRTLLLA